MCGHPHYKLAFSAYYSKRPAAFGGTGNVAQDVTNTSGSTTPELVTPEPVTPKSAVPMRVTFKANDGYALNGQWWRTGPAHATGQTDRATVIINPATSVRARYYARFAAYLHQHGFDVLTYDYRGIGESRPARLRGFQASWLDWGRLDFEAALGFVVNQSPSQPIYVVGHSVGGFLIGLAPSSNRIARIFTMGSQYAYWRDYAPHLRWRMYLKWHVFMPMVSKLFGYFPGKRLGWVEDTPLGVVQDWSALKPRIEDMWREAPHRLNDDALQTLLNQFSGVKANTLAVSVGDDEFATQSAIQRLLSYYTASSRTHLHIDPAQLGSTPVGHHSIGHFGFFHSQFEKRLWHIPLHWLCNGCLPSDPPGYLVSLSAPTSTSIERTN